MKNNDWIKELKVGDVVAVDDSNMWHKNYYKKLTVDKITPTGRIKAGGRQFYSDGRELGNSSYKLKQFTPEIEELIERRELLYKIKFNEFEGLLSTDRLKILLEWQKELLNK